MDQNIAARIKKIIAEDYGIKKEEITESSSFKDDLGLDSLDCVELTMAMEEEFNICISDEDASEMNTIMDAVRYIEKQLKKK